MHTPDHATLFCYSCRTFQPKAAMRRIVTRSGERWRCTRCLEAAGMRGANTEGLAQTARREALIDEILRENPWAQRKKDHVGRALFFSLIAHIALVSLQFGGQGFGMPWSRPAEDDRPMQAARISAVLRAPIARIESMQVADYSPPPPTTVPTTTESQIRSGATLASLRSAGRSAEAAETAKPDSATPKRKEKGKTAVRSKGAEVLGTEVKSTWQIPVARQASSAAEEESPAESAIKVEVTEKSVAIPDEAAQKLAEKLAAIAKENEEALQRKRAEEWAAANAIQEAAERQHKAEQAAIAKASEEALERRQTIERLRLEAENKLAEQAAEKARQQAIEQKTAEEQLRAETERRRLEAAAMEKARQDAAERLRAEERAQEIARADAARQQAEQAAAAKARQEASQQALDKTLDAKRAEDLARGRQAGPEANAQSGAGKPTDRGQNQGTRAPEHSANTSPGRSQTDPVGADTRRKASIIGPDPRNIQLSFYGEGWRQKVERIGSVNYPKVYRDRYYDTLVVTVTINSDGSLAGVRIDKSSGQKEMDDAVLRIVAMSAPFAAFPPDLKRSYDQLDITRTWSFEHGPRIRSQ